MAIVNLNYGHEGTGKLYSYYDRSGTRRAGDIVVVEVSKKNGETFKTLGIIRSTHGSGTTGEADTKEFLGGKTNSQGDLGIELKPVLGGSKEQLPSFERFKDKEDENGVKIKNPSAEWQRDSKNRYFERVKARLYNMEV